MTHILSSEDILMAERHEQRCRGRSCPCPKALRTVENHDNGLERQRSFSHKSQSRDIHETSIAVNKSQKVKLPDNRVITYQIDARGRRIGNKVNLEMGFIVDLHGNFIWFRNNITTFNWDYIEGYQFDFSKCICEDKI